MEPIQRYIRATRYFTWRDARGLPWRDVLRENVRKEFEAARFEKGPEVVTRLLLGGHDVVENVVEKLVEKQRLEVEKAGPVVGMGSAANWF